MPAPPPPPPMSPACPPPPPSFNIKPSKSSGTERNNLLKDIRSGARLKKTVTNDRSAPIVGGSSKPSNSSGVATLPVIPISGLKNGGGAVSPKGGVRNGSSPVTPIGGMKFGSLQEELSRKMASVNNHNQPDSRNETKNFESKNFESKNFESKNFGNIQMELKKQLANDNRNRGPPPPTPTRGVIPDSSSRTTHITNGFHKSQFSLNSCTTLQANPSTLHRKAKSNANLSTLDSTDNASGMRPNKPVISHGKPNLAPKPPVLNGKPNVLQLKPSKPVSRTHSLKSPRSPSPGSPDVNPMNKFGTVRHMSSMLSQTLGNHGVPNGRPRPAINTRPTAPPPSIPVPVTPNHLSMSSSQTPPPSKVNKPNHAPPPPPPISLPQAPSHAPPPPPHKVQVNKPVPTGSNPPSPPPRHSSMRDNHQGKKVNFLDDRFKKDFHTPDQFPSPPPYKRVIKLYNSVSVKPAPVKPVSVA